MSFADYFVPNVPLFAISFVMYYLAIRNIRIRRKESIDFIVFSSLVLVLSVVVFFDKYAQLHGMVHLATVMTSLGYILRPALMYIFILLANMGIRRRDNFFFLWSLPIFVNAIIYILPLFFNVPGISTIVFSYENVTNEAGETIAHLHRGSILNFSSHALCAVYLGLLIFISTNMFHGKRSRDGVILIICALILSGTVVVEMIFNRNDLLNIVCDICAMINYIFIISVSSSRDPLTKLYDRRAYYEDLARYKKYINGVIQIDMNELKYLNDNFGHDAGDIALNVLANIFGDNINRNSMCPYRLSGDEFVILMFKGKKDDLEKAVASIRKRVKDSSYSAAIGYCYFETKKDGTTFEQAMKRAEELMYLDKSQFYESVGHDRRRD